MAPTILSKRIHYELTIFLGFFPKYPVKGISLIKFQWLLMLSQVLLEDSG